MKRSHKHPLGNGEIWMGGWEKKKFPTYRLNTVVRRFITSDVSLRPMALAYAGSFHHRPVSYGFCLRRVIPPRARIFSNVLNLFFEVPVTIYYALNGFAI